jgi:hypothetical protein
MPGDFLYHYCSLDAFLGIIRSKEIWLTNIFYMNDSAEHYWLRHVAQDVLRRRKTSTSDELCRSIAAKLFPPEEKTEMYCGCFSEDGDSLGQWRAYADDGRGVAIGFSRQMLRETVCDDPDLILEDVVYDRIEQERIVEEIIDAKSGGGNQSLASGLPRERTLNLDRIVAEVELWYDAARCKNPRFREEHEFRVIYRPSPGPCSPRLGQRQFRSRGDLLIPYYALPIPTDVDDPKIPVLYRIVFGPKSAHKLNRPAAEQLLHDEGYNMDRIRFGVSEATYR